MLLLYRWSLYTCVCCKGINTSGFCIAIFYVYYKVLNIYLYRRLVIWLESCLVKKGNFAVWFPFVFLFRGPFLFSCVWRHNFSFCFSSSSVVVCVMRKDLALRGRGQQQKKVGGWVKKITTTHPKPHRTSQKEKKSPPTHHSRKRVNWTFRDGGFVWIHLIFTAPLLIMLPIIL